MKKKLVLLMAATAMLGLSACDDGDSTENCVNNSKKCADNSIWSCIEGAWYLEKACATGETCNDMKLTCEAAATCTTGVKRCGDKAVEICANGAWKVETQCKTNETCNDKNLSCEAAEVCTVGAKRCEGTAVQICDIEKGWKVETQCKTNETCNATKWICEAAVACTTGAKRCTDKAIEICNAGAWTVEKQCKTNETCNATSFVCEVGTVTCIDGDKRCENNAIELCVANAWKLELACADKTCNPETFACDVASVCTEGWKRCNANVVEICGKDNKYAPISKVACAVGTYCIEQEDTHSTDCVECTNNDHCKDKAGKTCDMTSHTCKATVTESSITWCNSQHLDSTNKVSYGRVLDNSEAKSPESITAKVLCGKAGQAISDYQKIAGIHNAACDNCGNNFEYSADLSSLSNGSYLCLWSFNMVSEPAVACKTGEAGVVRDFSIVPTSSIAFEYTVAGVKPVWDSLIDFENFTTVAAMDTKASQTVGNVTTSIFGGIYKMAVGSITANSLVFSEKAADGYVIISNTESARLNVLSFDYKSYGDDDFEQYDPARTLKVYFDEEATATYTIELKGKVAKATNVKYDVNKNVKTVKIQKAYQGTLNAYPRTVIDNISLTGALLP